MEGIKTVFGTYVHSTMAPEIGTLLKSKKTTATKTRKKSVTVGCTATLVGFGLTVKITGIKSKGFYNYEVTEGQYAGKTGWASTKGFKVA